MDALKVGGDTGKPRAPFVLSERVAIGGERALQVFLLLWQALQLARRLAEVVATAAIPVAELRGLAIADRVAALLRLFERVSCPVDVVEAVDEGPREAEERVRPVRA